jgi:hypothetical protein
MGEGCSTNGREEKLVEVIGGKASEKDTLGRRRHGWLIMLRCILER